MPTVRTIARTLKYAIRNPCVTAEHEFDERIDVEIRRPTRLLTDAVAHDGDAVAELENFIEPMADIDD